MSKIRILVAFDRVIGYTEDKKLIKDFIKENKIRDYDIFKVKEIPESVEDEFYVKEMYYDHHYDCIVTEELLTYVATYVGGSAQNLLELEEGLRYIMEYVKMEPHEKDMIFEMHHHIRAICSDTIGIDQDSPEGFYSDYFDIALVIKRYLEGL